MVARGMTIALDIGRASRANRVCVFLVVMGRIALKIRPVRIMRNERKKLLRFLQDSISMLT
jgi:hypothetical protein